MKYAEYRDLAKRSLAARKKSTNATVASLALGLTILIPVIVMLFGVNINLNRQINAQPYALYFETTMTDYRIATQDSMESELHLSGSEHLEDILGGLGAAQPIVYEAHPIVSYWDEAYSCRIGDGERMELPNINEQYSIIDAEKSDAYLPQNLQTFPGGIFVSGCDGGFTENGKRQVIVSEAFLSSLNLRPQEAYGKALTIWTPQTEDAPSGYLCKDYTIVGVVRAEISEFYRPQDGSQYNAKNLMRSALFFTSPNAYNADNRAYFKPHFRYFTDENGEERSEIVLDRIDELPTLNQEFMYLYDVFQNDIRLFVGGNTYAAAIRAWEHTEAVIDTAPASPGDVSGRSFTEPSRMLTHFQLLFNLTDLLSLIVSLVCGILLAAALINFYATIRHSVRERQYFLTMLRAIGARNDVLPKLYLTESAILATRAACFFVPLSFGLSVGIKYLIAAGLKKAGLTGQLAISWTTIVAGVLIGAVFLYGVTLLFGWLCSRTLAKKKIPEVLGSV